MSNKLSISLFLFAFALLSACSKKDTTLPEINIKGDAQVIVTLNSPYIDAGATATDDVDGILTVTTDGSIDTNFAGNYYITYSAIDASANLAEATRTVIVRNEAYIYNGSYSAISAIGIDSSFYTTPVTTSNTINQRVWLVGYSNISTAVVYADFRNDTINIPHQIVNTVSPSQVHAFSGNGFVKTINDHTVFEISFSDSVAGNIYTGTSVYTKN